MPVESDLTALPSNELRVDCFHQAPGLWKVSYGNGISYPYAKTLVPALYFGTIGHWDGVTAMQ